VEALAVLDGGVAANGSPSLNARDYTFALTDDRGEFKNRRFRKSLIAHMVAGGLACAVHVEVDSTPLS
jgi:hypothetical protein